MSKLVRLLSVLAVAYALFSFAAVSDLDPSFVHCEEPQEHLGLDDNASLAALFRGALSEGKIIWTLILALLAGFLTSLSPCVYPLIPITLSIMGARSYESHAHGFLVAGSYVLGMSTVYTALGALFAYLGIVAGSLMQSSLILIIFAALFVLMSLVMLGFLEIRLPSWLLNKLNHVGGKGFKGAFLMGLVAGLIAAPCTGPVLGAILAFIAHDQNLFLGIALMAIFSLGLGLPFLALGTFSSAVSHLPKSGAWMSVIKNLLAMIMLSMAVYFFALALEPMRELLLNIYNIGSFILIILILIGLIIARSKKNIIIFSGIIISSVSISALIYNYNYEPLNNKLENNLNWHLINAETKNINYLDELLSQAQQSCRPVFIDFYADWCVSCRQLSSQTFVDPRVKDRLEQFFLIKVDSSQSSALLSAVHKRFSVTGLPTIIILDRSNKEASKGRLMGFLQPKALLKALASY